MPKKLILALACVFASALSAHAQVAYETSLTPASSTFLSAGGSVDVTFDAGSGANRTMDICVVWRDQGNTLSAVEYPPGTGATSLGAKLTETNFSGQLWRLANPASGSNTLRVTMGAGASNSPGMITAIVLNNTDISGTPVDGYVSAQGNGSTASIASSPGAITSAANDMITICAGSFNVVGNLTSTATNFTERQDAATGGGISVTIGQAAGAATVTPTATWNNGAGTSVNWMAFGLNHNVLPSAGGATPRLTLLGVGGQQ